MKSLSVVKPKSDLDLAISMIRAIDPSIILAFVAPALACDDDVKAKLHAAFPAVPFLGCSTSGEIVGDGVHDEAVVFVGMRFDQTRVRTAHVKIERPEDAEKIGEMIAAQLQAPDLKSVFILSPGHQMNGSALVRGLYNAVSPDVVVTGGLAGDGLQFGTTYTLYQGTFASDQVVAFGLYGEAIEVSTGCEGGWRPFGPARVVTRAEGNVLYDLDNRPALALYDEYLGTLDRNNPASRLSYPFAVLREDRSSAGLIRSALGVDIAKNALVLAGEVKEGCYVCLMHADTDGLIQGAAQAAAEAIRMHKTRHALGVALIVSCVGRRLVMNIDTDEEIEAVRDSFDEGMTIAGFYSYGEIAPFAKGKRPELHNQTMTVTYISEKNL
jgi:hypothetical protein